MRKLLAMMILMPIITLSLETLLALGAAQEAQLSPEGVQKIDVVVDSYTFRPDHIVVTANKPVELTLKSVTSLIPHNLTIKNAEGGLDVDQDVPHGKNVKITFTPAKPGTYEFYCDKKFLFDSHKDKGMIGILEVKE